MHQTKSFEHHQRHATLVVCALITIAISLPLRAKPSARRRQLRPALHEAHVNIVEGSARFHRGTGRVAGARVTLGKPWWGDVDADGRAEVLAEVSYVCVDVARCGNTWGGYLAMWRWRRGRYRLVATQLDVKSMSWLRVVRGRITLHGDVQTGPGRQDVERVSITLRQQGPKLVVVPVK